MIQLLETHGYAIAVTLLLFSTFVSGVELASIRGLHIDLVFPHTGRINKRALWLGLHLAEGSLAVVTWIAFRYGQPLQFRVLFVLLGAVVALSYRLRTAGKDGADQMRLLSYLAYALGFLLSGSDGERIPMYFIGGQVVIAYGTAGMVKALSKYWRGGQAVSRILSNYSYGWPRIGNVLAARPALDRVCSYSPIVMMLLVPVAFFLPFHLPLVAALGLMFCFHLSAAALMGLNDFVATFTSAYPGVILLHSAAIAWLLG